MTEKKEKEPSKKKRSSTKRSSKVAKSSETEKWAACGTGLESDGAVLKYSKAASFAVGGRIIKQGQHEWIVKYDSNGKEEGPSIGIISNWKNINLDRSIYHVKCSITFRCNKDKDIRTFYGGTSHKTFKTGLRSIKKGETVKVMLDLFKNFCTFYMPANDKTPVAKVPLPKASQEGWRIVGELGKPGESWTILSSKKSPSPLNLLQLGKINDTLKDRLKNLTNKNKFNKVVKQVKELEMNSLAHLKEDIRYMENHYSTFKDNFDKYLEKIHELEKIIDRQVNLDLSDYTSWSSADIVRFILHFENGVLKDYESVLQKNVVDKKITGAQLKNVTNQDVKLWGVGNFRDRTKMFKAIQQIINGEGAMVKDDE